MCSQMEQDPQKKKNDQDCALMGFGSQFALGVRGDPHCLPHLKANGRWLTTVQAARASIKTAKSSTPTVANQ